MNHKIRIDESMVEDIYYSDPSEYKTIFISFNDKIKKFLRNVDYEVEFIKKPTYRKLYVVESCEDLSPIETLPIRVMFFKTVGFCIKFSNKKDFVKFKLKFS